MRDLKYSVVNMMFPSNPPPHSLRKAKRRPKGTVGEEDKKIERASGDGRHQESKTFQTQQKRLWQHARTGLPQVWSRWAFSTERGRTQAPVPNPEVSPTDNHSQISFLQWS
jgi:hypothetical protein